MCRGDSLVQQFYMEKQQPEQSTTEYDMKLKKNASRHNFHIIKNFDQIKKLIREIELILATSASNTKSDVGHTGKSQIPHETNIKKVGNILNKLNIWTKKLALLKIEVKNWE